MKKLIQFPTEIQKNIIIFLRKNSSQKKYVTEKYADTLRPTTGVLNIFQK
jgi:hypothetical protein